MKSRKNYRIFLICWLIIAVLMFVFYFYYLINKNIPQIIYLTKGEKYRLNIEMPVSADINSEDIEASYNIAPKAANNIEIKTYGSKFSGEDIVVSGENVGTGRINLKLFGIFALTDVEVRVTEKLDVYPGGQPIGIYLDTDGIMIIGSGEIILSDGSKAEPAYGIVNAGDYILAVNGDSISSKEELTQYIAQSEGREVVLTLRRKESIINVKVKPLRCNDGCYRTGIWVRDNTQGIGTLTFVLEDSRFAALGHGISDVDTSQLIEVDKGALYDACIFEIIKGENGKPGSLVGSIDYSEKTFEGYILANTNEGVFGSIKDVSAFIKDKKTLPVGYSQNVNKGKAYIVCCIDGYMKKFEIDIEKIDFNSKSNKNMVIRVVDNELLNTTGGIIQGMSGSPIIQDGKMIGAVTHVMVNDPSRGYGIFIEKMLESCE
ncbi:MAG: SpoIVB peptidase [Lachnospiraceae bacterium]|nr:SpoIVB peptidase [Lachnospiraceae bacterium]